MSEQKDRNDVTEEQPREEEQQQDAQEVEFKAEELEERIAPAQINLVY